MNCDSDGIFLLGDFNSRIGSMSEMLFEADEITKRNQIDNCVNQHGHEFLEFLNESKFCVLNGRFADGDNYTSISKKGKAVVDFICVPQDMFPDVKYFRVLAVQSIDFKLHDLIGSKSKLPDHSAIVSEFNITRHCLATQTKDTRSSCSRFKLNQIPLDFYDYMHESEDSTSENENTSELKTNTEKMGTTNQSPSFMQNFNVTSASFSYNASNKKDAALIMNEPEHQGISASKHNNEIKKAKAKKKSGKKTGTQQLNKDNEDNPNQSTLFFHFQGNNNVGTPDGRKDKRAATTPTDQIHERTSNIQKPKGP
ncbi:unnamed protein product [Mytilus edulis]|uniref:Endonuclease/exonuclease/phosphatase domain-containing protein n=1 Tax=Mytilus edulis TaxID=6550 RepID=A0A8S3Q6B7_MYTED|nr:unnamed protein product [Mytilus edulis]